MQEVKNDLAIKYNYSKNVQDSLEFVIKTVKGVVAKPFQDEVLNAIAMNTGTVVRDAFTQGFDYGRETCRNEIESKIEH